MARRRRRVRRVRVEKIVRLAEQEAECAWCGTRIDPGECVYEYSDEPQQPHCSAECALNTRNEMLQYYAGGEPDYGDPGHGWPEPRPL